jgi:enoyl-CoA hydratase/carnithine racemase
MDARVKPAHDEKGESMPYETILYDADGAVATITLNRPEQLNTIVPSMPDKIEAAVHEAVHGPNVKLIVLRGQGARSAADSISAPASISGTSTSPLTANGTRARISCSRPRRRCRGRRNS